MGAEITQTAAEPTGVYGLLSHIATLLFGVGGVSGFRRWRDKRKTQSGANGGTKRAVEELEKKLAPLIENNTQSIKSLEKTVLRFNETLLQVNTTCQSVVTTIQIVGTNQQNTAGAIKEVNHNQQAISNLLSELKGRMDR